tara:strand:- start:97 stop:705 length:609 start_codon:yes stop_codon:yes gene_type:complete
MSETNIYVHNSTTHLPSNIAAQLYDLDKLAEQDSTLKQSRDSYSGISASPPPPPGEEYGHKLAIVYKGDFRSEDCVVLGKVEYGDHKNINDPGRKWIYIYWLVASRKQGYTVLRKFEDFVQGLGYVGIELCSACSDCEDEERSLIRMNFYQRAGYRFTGIKYGFFQCDEGIHQIGDAKYFLDVRFTRAKEFRVVSGSKALIF